MAVYFYGEDTFGAHEAILQRDPDATPRWLDAGELKQEAVARLRNTQPGLFGRQLTVVRDPSALSKTTRDSLAEHFIDLSDDIILWDRVKPDKRGSLWRAVKKEAHEFTFPSGPDLITQLKERAKHQGAELSTGAAELLLERLGSGRWLLHTELDRLCLLASEISNEVVTQEVSGSVPTEVFTMLDALVGGDSKRAITAVQHLLQEGASEFYILAMLAYQYRVILLVVNGLAEGQTETEISRTAKLHPYVVKKNLPVARQVTRAEVVTTLTKIAATDFAFKQGKINPRDGLMMLLTGLTKAN